MIKRFDIDGVRNYTMLETNDGHVCQESQHGRG